MDVLAIRFIIAAVAYYLLAAFIDTIIADVNANKAFRVILLILCILFALFGGAIIPS